MVKKSKQERYAAFENYLVQAVRGGRTQSILRTMMRDFMAQHHPEELKQMRLRAREEAKKREK